MKFLDSGFGGEEEGQTQQLIAKLYEQSDQAFYRLALLSNFYKAGPVGGSLDQSASASQGGLIGQIGGDVTRAMAGGTVFERALAIVFVNEGGFTVDNGGPTMRGVTWSTYNRFYKKLGLPYISYEEALGGGAFKSTVTKEVATRIFKLGYWDPAYCDNLVLKGLNKSAMVALDISINGGDGRAKAFLREYFKVTANTQLPAAIAIAYVDDTQLANWLNERMHRFRKGAKGGSLWKVYGRGWQRRYEFIKREIPRFQ